MNPPPMFWEVLRALEIFAGWFVLFVMGHRPPTPRRRAALIAAFPTLYIAWYLIPLSDVANEISWSAILVTFALICGNVQSSLFTAIWYIGVEQCLDVIRSALNHYINGGVYVPNYPQYNAAYLVVLAWAVFYYRVKRKSPGLLPLPFKFLIIAVPLIGTVYLTRFQETIRQAASDTDLYQALCLEKAILGIFFLAVNILMFFLYTRLHNSYETAAFALEVAKPPPVWTPEHGLSDEAAKRYDLSPREKQVVDLMLKGKAVTYKELAIALDISPRTVEVYLRGIYRKTGVVNMTGLYTLIKG